MKLFSSAASPFATKVEMAAHVIGLEMEIVKGDVVGQAPDILAANPLGKVPCLVLDDGRGVYDSRTITRWMDRQSGGKLFPAADPDLFAAEQMESLCDGICDAAVAFRFEEAFRPAEKVHVPWQDRQWGKVERGLKEAAKSLPSSASNPDIRAIALSATLGYLQLRYSGQWESGSEALIDWQKEFFANNPQLEALKPSA